MDEIISSNNECWARVEEFSWICREIQGFHAIPPLSANHIGSRQRHNLQWPFNQKSSINECARHARSRSCHVSFWQLSLVTCLQHDSPTQQVHFTSSSRFCPTVSSDAAQWPLILFHYSRCGVATQTLCQPFPAPALAFKAVIKPRISASGMQE